MPAKPNKTSTPRKRKQGKVDKVEEAATNVLINATAVMATICNNMEQRAEQKQSNAEPKKEIRAFCEMIYCQLCNFDGDELDDIQMEIADIIRQRKRARRQQLAGYSASGGLAMMRSPSTMSDMTINNSENNDGCSVYSTISNAYSTLDDY